MARPWLKKRGKRNRFCSSINNNNNKQKNNPHPPHKVGCEMDHKGQIVSKTFKKKVRAEWTPLYVKWKRLWPCEPPSPASSPWEADQSFCCWGSVLCAPGDIHHPCDTDKRLLFGLLFPSLKTEATLVMPSTRSCHEDQLRHTADTQT